MDILILFFSLLFVGTFIIVICVWLYYHLKNIQEEKQEINRIIRIITRIFLGIQKKKKAITIEKNEEDDFHQNEIDNFRSKKEILKNIISRIRKYPNKQELIDCYEQNCFSEKYFGDKNKFDEDLKNIFMSQICDLLNIDIDEKIIKIRIY